MIKKETVLLLKELFPERNKPGRYFKLRGGGLGMLQPGASPPATKISPCPTSSFRRVLRNQNSPLKFRCTKDSMIKKENVLLLKERFPTGNSITHSLNHSFTQSLIYSITHSLNHPFTQLLIHTITHSPNHPLLRATANTRKADSFSLLSEPFLPHFLWFVRHRYSIKPHQSFAQSPASGLLSPRGW